MQEVKVSVLIAIYNAGKYLEECLSSLARQSLKECQFICIDDCSTDSSADIVKRYVAADERFVLLTTPVNSGQAIARNLGLNFAKGKYITMLDADDWFDEQSLEKAYNTIESTSECDCSLFRLVMIDDGAQTTYSGITDGVYSGQEAFRLSLDWSLHGYYLIRRDIHLKYPYDTACRLYSDDNTTRLHFLHSRRVAFSDGIYYYRQHQESMTHKFTIEHFLFMDAFSSMKSQILAEISLGNIDQPEEVLTQFENLRWFNFLSMVRYYLDNKNKMSAQEQADILDRLKTKLQTFETDRIESRFHYRFGYMPIKNWRLFYLQQTLFWHLYPHYRSLVSRCRL